MRKSECRGIPSKPALLTGHGILPAQKPDRRESPPGDSADKMTRETCPGKSSNGKEKRPRSRREKVSVPGFFHTSPEIKIPSPEKRIPGLGILRSGPEISCQAVQKVNCSDKTLHKSPVLCKKIARKSAIWAGLRKSRVTKIIQNGTICLFSQAFYDILIFQKHVFLVDERDGCVLFPVSCGLYHLIDGAVSLFAVIAFFASGMCLPRHYFLF